MSAISSSFKVFSTSPFLLLRPLVRNSAAAVGRQCSSVNASNDPPESTTPAPKPESKSGPTNYRSKLDRREFRHIFPDFLPDPERKYRNRTVEKLCRKDMVRRRSVVEIPEFYVGSLMAVTWADQHSQDKSKTSRFVGLCINRGGCMLNSWIKLRNVIDGQGIEFLFYLYSPVVQKIETLRLRKVLDEDLEYLRDCPLEHSTFPQNSELEILPEGVPVPIEDKVITLNPMPWRKRYEVIAHRYKGFRINWEEWKEMSQKKYRFKHWAWFQHLNPGWHEEVLEYDLLLQYHETIPVEEQDAIWREVGAFLEERDQQMKKVAAKRAFLKPEKRR